MPSKHREKRSSHQEFTKIPPRFQKKFDELKLSGETVPTVGEASPDVIFIKGF